MPGMTCKTLLGALACAWLLEAAEPACFATVNVYDEHGAKLPFVVARVFKAEAKQLGNLPERRREIRAVGNRLYFAKAVLGLLLDVELRGPVTAGRKTPATTLGRMALTN